MGQVFYYATDIFIVIWVLLFLPVRDHCLKCATIHMSSAKPEIKE